MNLIVVGGGPAGAAAAITARQAGLSVTLLEASRGGRFRPGETLQPGVEPILDQLEARTAVLDAGYLRHTGTWVQWGGAPEFVPFGSDHTGPWRGFQAPRADFDQRLLNTASGLGVQVREQTSANGLVTRKSRVVGVSTADGVLNAEHVIDASGGRHWMARQLGIPIVRYSVRLTARYGYVCDARVERAPSIRADVDGWTWIADLGHGRSVWMRVTTPDRVVSTSWLPDELRDARPTAPAGGSDVTWRMAAKAAGDGWFICGDAAVVLDPSSSHGVLRGLMSGIAAARGAVSVSGAYGAADRVADAYTGWLGEWFRYDARKMSEHYRSVHLFGH
jgi:flavin-dependent dehydrogenase